MGLRDFVKKKDRLGESDDAYSETLNKIAGPEFTFIRSDTNTHEIIFPPSRAGSSGYLSAQDQGSTTSSKSRRSLDVFRSRSRGSSHLSVFGDGDGDSDNSATAKDRRRLSHRLGLSRRTPKTSEYVPENLPQITVINSPDGPSTEETQWEKRATMLATTNEARQRSRPQSTAVSPSASYATLDSDLDRSSRGNSGVNISSKEIDRDIQEAIRLHEEGDLERSTQLFGRLADPYGANNPLSQVLYGLALRHGWGCEPNLERAIIYLSAAASNAAAVESTALKAGGKKGGAAKGELVLAIFELANCFRHGWGIAKDPVAAKQYYETAANLGDNDAMNETAWCYLEGFGCKKDKFQAARYYRLAEKNGSKTLGNSWIWKEKYNPK
ncbi:HCP-like protein [Xylaria sp. CBS 124048]|nr:HCP-like protein [Xylaria sp. CBS 124048]